MNYLRPLGCWLLLGPAAAQQVRPIPFPPPIWNSAPAMLRLGNAYSRGQGAPLDEPMALRCYQRAAELGSLVATDNVGTYYALGRGAAAGLVQPSSQGWLRAGHEQPRRALQLSHARQARPLPGVGPV